MFIQTIDYLIVFKCFILCLLFTQRLSLQLITYLKYTHKTKQKETLSLFDLKKHLSLF